MPVLALYVCIVLYILYVLEIIKCHRAQAVNYPGRCFTTLCLASLH